MGEVRGMGGALTKHNMRSKRQLTPTPPAMIGNMPDHLLVGRIAREPMIERDSS